MVEQQQIPGTEDTVHPEVSKAAKAYVAVRDERMALTKRETEAKAALLEACRAADVDHYVIEGGTYEVVFTKSEDVKVRRVKSSPADDDGEEG